MSHRYLKNLHAECLHAFDMCFLHVCCKQFYFRVIGGGFQGYSWERQDQSKIMFENNSDEAFDICLEPFGNHLQTQNYYEKLRTTPITSASKSMCRIGAPHP